jgi:hypothetical protein
MRLKPILGAYRGMMSYMGSSVDVAWNPRLRHCTEYDSLGMSNKSPGHDKRILAYLMREELLRNESQSGKPIPEGNPGYVWLIRFIHRAQPRVDWLRRLHDPHLDLMLSRLEVCDLIESVTLPSRFLKKGRFAKDRQVTVYRCTPEGHIVRRMGLAGLEDFVERTVRREREERTAEAVRDI